MTEDEKINILEEILELAGRLTQLEDDPLLESRGHLLVAYTYDALRQKAPFRYLEPNWVVGEAGGHIQL